MNYLSKVGVEIVGSEHPLVFPVSPLEVSRGSPIHVCTSPLHRKRMLRVRVQISNWQHSTRQEKSPELFPIVSK